MVNGKLIIWGLLFAFWSWLLWSYMDNKKALALALHENSSYALYIEKQNKAIEKIKLDSTKYKKDLPKQEEHIKKKYVKVYLKDETCQNKLETLSDLLNVFYNNKEANL